MRTKGFTLYEFIIVLAILGILAGIAAPSFSVFIANQKVRNATQDLQVAFLRARSEALNRNTVVSVLPVNGAWSSGWQISNPSASGAYIDQHEALQSVVVSSAVNSVSYSNLGRLTSSASFEITSPVDDTVERCLMLDLSGRPKVKLCACASTC